MDKATLEQHLREISNARDDKRLQELVDSLSAADIQQYKTELTEAWLGIYEIWMYDHACHKVIMDQGPDVFFSYLLRLLTEAEKINVPVIYYEERSYCYQELAALNNNLEEQLLYIEKAIREIVEVLKGEPSSCRPNCRMVSILLDKIKFNNQFTNEEFEQAFDYFERALTRFEKTELSSLLYLSFNILEFPFSQNQHWHTTFISKLMATLHAVAGNDWLVYLEWAEELNRMFGNKLDTVPENYINSIIKQFVEFLQHLAEVETDNKLLLIRLGQVFYVPAVAVGEPDWTPKAIRYYEIALKYFIRSQELDPSIWNAPVFATNVLLTMANIYYNMHDRDAMIQSFERGLVIFEKMVGLEDDYTTNLNWGRFTIEYARLAYDFKAPVLLQQSESKFLLAKAIGENYFTAPFYGLAKIALKTGDRAKCLAILQECKTAFSTDYYEFSLRDVIEDNEYAEILPEILIIENG